MDKKTILQIVPSLISGGVEKCVVELNEYLVKNGFNSIVLSSGGKLSDLIVRAGGKHIKLNVATKNPLLIWRNIKKIKKIITDNRVDIVHVMSRAPAISAYYACKKLNVPLVSTIHGRYNYGGSFLFLPLKRKYNSYIHKADYIICVSNFIKNYANEHDLSFGTKLQENKVTVIRNGVDTDLFDPKNVSPERMIALSNKLNLPDDKNIILLPGRLTEWKGQLWFLDILSKLKHTNYLCLMLGDGNKRKKYRSAILAMIDKLNLRGFVMLGDNISDMQTAYLLSCMVISSSILPEAFGLVSVEAQAMGKMVVATALGGSLETIIDGKTGWLIKPDDKDKFAETIDAVLDMSPEELRVKGQEARQFIIDNYSIDKTHSRVVELYNKILRERS